MKSLLYSTLVFLFFTHNSFGQEKAKNHDLRVGKQLSSIKSHTDKSKTVLEETAGGEFTINVHDNKKNLKKYKISSQDAKAFDDYYVSQFIHIKYMMESIAKTEKKCRKAFTLSMRGEDQDICVSEGAKIKKMDEMLRKLSKTIHDN